MSSVSRSVYQKLKEENNRLLRDIYILCHDKYFCSGERTLVIMKWRKKYEEDKEFRELLTAHAKQYIQNMIL